MAYYNEEARPTWKRNDNVELYRDPINNLDHPHNTGHFTGTIVDTWQYAHSYLVTHPRGLPAIAMATTAAGFDPGASQESHHYRPGTQVLCHRPVLDGQTFILGAIPPVNTDYYYSTPDWILTASETTFKDDAVHNTVLSLQNRAGVEDRNNNRPLDAYPGEWHVSNVLGFIMHMGLTSLTLRATDLAGLQLFYLDHTVRLNAFNYQFWNAGLELTAGEDEGENTQLERSSPYPWEMKGIVQFGQASYQLPFGEAQDNGDLGAGAVANVWTAGNNQAYVEPLEEDQMGVFRYHRFAGYLGDLERIIVSCPGRDLVTDAATPETLSRDTNHIGLSETMRHPNGMLEMRSTKGIALIKDVFIPVPKQRKLPDDPAGDSAAQVNYKFAGQFGEAAPAHDKSEFQTTASPASSAFDMFSWLHQSYGLQSLYRHQLDWYVPEEVDSDLYTQSGSMSVDRALFVPTQAAFLAAMPAYASVQIDHRPGHSHRFYRARSMVYLYDSGGVLIEDAYGSQIEMDRGNIRITCQNDILMTPGRSIVLMAPHDVIARAGSAVDISAGQGDVRIKAETNLHVLGGNSGQGGVLIESRSVGKAQHFDGLGSDAVSSGIIFKAPDSQILAYASDLYLRTIHSGNLILDADGGNGTLQMYASQTILLNDELNIVYGTKPGQQSTPTAVETHSGQEVVFGQKGDFVIKAATAIMPTTNASLTVNGLVEGVYMAKKATDGKLSSWGPGTNTFIIETSSQTDQALQSIGQQSVQLPLGPDMPYGSSQAPGASTFIAKAGFSFRTDMQYGIQNLIFYEARWQQLYRLTQSSTATWVEPAVKAPTGENTAPFPGYNSWYTQALYQTVNLSLWDFPTGEQTGPAASSPAATPTAVTFQQGYLINLQ